MSREMTPTYELTDSGLWVPKTLTPYLDIYLEELRQQHEYMVKVYEALSEVNACPAK